MQISDLRPKKIKISLPKDLPAGAQASPIPAFLPMRRGCGQGRRASSADRLCRSRPAGPASPSVRGFPRAQHQVHSHPLRGEGSSPSATAPRDNPSAPRSSPQAPAPSGLVSTQRNAPGSASSSTGAQPLPASGAIPPAGPPSLRHVPHHHHHHSGPDRYRLSQPGRTESGAQGRSPSDLPPYGGSPPRGAPAGT